MPVSAAARMGAMVYYSKNRDNQKAALPNAPQKGTPNARPHPGDTVADEERTEPTERGVHGLWRGGKMSAFGDSSL